jgi:hypothetical protein
MKITHSRIRLSMTLRDAIDFLLGSGDSVRRRRSIERQLPFHYSLLLLAEVVMGQMRVL